MESKEIVAKEVARQAEFGMEPSWEDFVIAGKEAGIKEVVEWLESMAAFPLENLSYAERQDTPILENILFGEWQAKLREWKLDKEVS